MTEKNFSLIDLRSISKPACKVIDLVGKAIGLLYDPRRIRETASAEADAAVIRAEGDVRVEEVLSRARERRLNSEFRQQTNLESIVAFAIDELPEMVSEKPVDEDWIHHFLGNCADVGDKQMQDLWARILAGEVESPGRFSKRFLEFMKCLGKREALAIGEFYRHLWVMGSGEERSIVYFNDRLIYLNAQRAEPFIPYSLRMEMTTLGLVHENIAISVDRDGRVEFSYQGVPYFSEKNHSLPPKVPVDCLSTLGEELLYICKPTVAQDYLDACVHQYQLVPYEPTSRPQTADSLGTP